MNAARISVETAAARMGVTPMFLRMGLRLGRFPFGTAIQMPGGRWSYYINAERFRRYMAGEDMASAPSDAAGQERTEKEVSAHDQPQLQQ